MKRIAYIFAICAAALVSCSKPELGTGDAMAPGLNITLKMAGPATKAASTMPGVADLNENRIESITCLVFDGKDDSAKLVMADTKTVGVDVPSNGVSVNLALSEEKFSEVMYTGQARMYVIANATETFKSLTTVSQIKTQLLELSKKEGKQDSFVMYGVCDAISEVASVGDKRRAVASVDLKRVLAKVSLKIEVDNIFEKAVKADGTELAEDETSDVKVRWTPNKNEVKVVFSGLESRAMIAPDATFESALFDCAEKTFPLAVEKTNTFECRSDIPYYTYPRTWTIADNDKPYFLISIPWTSELVGTPVGDWFQPTTATTFYKVILGGTFASNNWYAISVALKGLGSLTPGTAVEISPLDLTVADWKDSVEGETRFHTEAQFQDARVLDIPQELITLYNQESASIPFISSHNCEIESVVLKQSNFQGSDVTIETTTLNHDQYPFAVNNAGKVITFYHELRNDLSKSSFDYQDYIYEVVIRHSDDEGHSYRDSFTLTQRPSLVIYAEKNTGSSTSTYTHFVNGCKPGSDSNTTGGLGSVSTAGLSGTNSNPNMFVISASVLNDGQRIIGDPRSLTSESWSSKSFVDVYGNTRQISNYYRTDANKGNVIAPKFRIASSWGKTTSISSLENAVKRCSAYQEEGYPAGRWRVPTEAEVEFMMTLSGKGYIVTLFTDGSYYWCNNGAIKNDSGVVTHISSSSSSLPVRCVYDDWYWENSKYATVDKYTPTWGDMKREDFE